MPTAQCVDGPELKVTRDITSHDVTELIRLLHEQLPGYTFVANHYAEGGLQLVADPAHTRSSIGDKSTRVFMNSRFTESTADPPTLIQRFKTRQNTPSTGMAMDMAWTRLHYNKVRTLLVARNGAPSWIIAEVRALEQTVA